MNDIGAQVQMAAQCCHLAEALITQEQNLWKVPQRLIDEARKVNKPKNVRHRVLGLIFFDCDINLPLLLLQRNLRKTKSIVSSSPSMVSTVVNIVKPNHVHRLVLQTGN